MIRYIFPVMVFGAVIFSVTGCQKCYRCYNECVRCSITINTNTFSHVLCKDSFGTQAAFDAAIAQDTGLGYTCATTAPTYNYEFCVNKPGEESYTNYFNQGKRVTCEEK